MKLPRFSSVVGIFYGLWLGIAATNYPFPGLPMSIATLLAPLALLIVFFCVVVQDDGLLVHYDILTIYFFYVCFFVSACFSTIMGGSVLMGIQPLIVLPVIPLSTYFFCHQFDVKPWIYRGFFIILMVGCLYTIYNGLFEIRARGMTTHPNSSAVILSLGAVFTVFLFFRSRSIWRKIFLAVVALMMIWGVLLTASRTGLMALGVAVVVLFGNSKSRWKWAILLLVVPVGVFMAKDFSYQISRVAGAYEVLTTGQSDNPGAKNVLVRLQANKAALDIFRDNLLLGVGPGGIKAAQRERTTLTICTHSGYVSLLAETGGMGTSLFFVFLLSILLVIPRTGKALRRSVPSSGMNWLLAGYLAMLCAAITWDIFKEKIFWIWLSIIAAELADYARRKSFYWIEDQQCDAGRAISDSAEYCPHG